MGKQTQLFQRKRETRSTVLCPVRVTRSTSRKEYIVQEIRCPDTDSSSESEHKIMKKVSDIFNS